MLDAVGRRARVDAAIPTRQCRQFLADLHSAAEARHGHVPADDTDHGSDGGSVPLARSTMEPLTVAEAAERLECSQRWVRKLAGCGRIVARRAGTVWLIDQTSLDRYARGDRDHRPDHPRTQGDSRPVGP